MTFTLTGWMLYTMWAVLGLMWLDFLISFVRSLLSGSFNLLLVLNYLKDMLYYVFPLFLIIALSVLDPLGWLLSVIFAIASLGIIFHYLMRIGKSFK